MWSLQCKQYDDETALQCFFARSLRLKWNEMKLHLWLAISYLMIILSYPACTIENIITIWGGNPSTMRDHTIYSNNNSLQSKPVCQKYHSIVCVSYYLQNFPDGNANCTHVLRLMSMGDVKNWKFHKYYHYLLRAKRCYRHCCTICNHYIYFHWCWTVFTIYSLIYMHMNLFLNKEWKRERERVRKRRHII